LRSIASRTDHLLAVGLALARPRSAGTHPPGTSIAVQRQVEQREDGIVDLVLVDR
jgi:hypothetical protein